MRKRILLVVSSLGHGGAERQVVQIANRMHQHEVHIASLSAFNPLAVNLNNPDKFHIVAKRGKYDLTVPFRLRRLIGRINANICHGILFDAEIATCLAKLMSRNKIAAIGSERNADYKPKYLHRMLRIVTGRLFDLVIANSESGARFVIQNYRLPSAKLRVVRNGVDLERFKIIPKKIAREELGLDSQEKLIGMVASFKPQKNHLGALQAISRLSDDLRGKIKFAFLGDSLDGGSGGNQSYKLLVQNKVAELKLQDTILFLGAQDNVEAYYPAFDFTLLPSFHEGTPNVVLESMACGIPCIVTDVSDNRHIVQNNVSGVVVTKGDEVALTEAIERLASDDQLLAKLGVQARTSVQLNFSNEAMCANLASIYDEL